MIVKSFVAAGLIILPAAAIAQVNAPPQMPPQAGQQPSLPGTMPATPSPMSDGTVGGDTLEPVRTMPPDSLPRPAMPGEPDPGVRQPDRLPDNSLSNPVQEQKSQDQARQQELMPD